MRKQTHSRQWWEEAGTLRLRSQSQGAELPGVRVIVRAQASYVDKGRQLPGKGSLHENRGGEGGRCVYFSLLQPFTQQVTDLFPCDVVDARRSFQVYAGVLYVEIRRWCEVLLC